jgi:hypothetical protein
VILEIKAKLEIGLNLTQSKNPPGIRLDQVISLSFDFKYSTAPVLAAKMGTMALTLGSGVLLPNSLGKNLFTPAAIAASMNFCWSPSATPPIILMTASWPFKAVVREEALL